MLHLNQIVVPLFLVDKDQMYLQFQVMQQELMLQHMQITYQQLHQHQQTTTLVM